MTPSTTLLRPALEAAVHVARAGEQASPVQPAPAALRRYLSFARLPGPALEIARKVVDDDEPFRLRVVAATSEDEVGEAGWLWLTRPEGWEARLDALRRQVQEEQHAERDRRVERDAQRRLSGAEAAARRAEAAATAAAQEAERLRTELAAERAERTRLQAELREAHDRMTRLADDRVSAVRDLKEVEALLASRTNELKHARHQLRMLQAELQQALDAPAPAAVAERGPEPPPAAAAPDVDRDALARAVGHAADAARQLSGALGDAARLLHLAPTDAPSPTLTRDAPAPPRPSTRRPLRLPPGVFDDSVEAADHLLRTEGVLLLVDGYNVAKAAWPDLAGAEMRGRLLDAVSELHARAGTDVEIVFDGADTGPVTRVARGGVRVRFSPPGVEADDVVLDLVATVPTARPVVVASSDNRVREGARRLGANVLHARQLLGALRR